MDTQSKWIINRAHSEIAFSVRYFLIMNVKGCFKVFDASIYTTNQDLTTAIVDLWIDVSSISTGNLHRDKALINANFFDANNHKQISFTSTEIGLANTNVIYELWGNLTILGIARNICLQLEYLGSTHDTRGNDQIDIAIKGKFKRSDWGLLWSNLLKSSRMFVGDEILIQCKIELTHIEE